MLEEFYVNIQSFIIIFSKEQQMRTIMIYSLIIPELLVISIV